MEGLKSWKYGWNSPHLIQGIKNKFPEVLALECAAGHLKNTMQNKDGAQGQQLKQDTEAHSTDQTQQNY